MLSTRVGSNGENTCFFKTLPPDEKYDLYAQIRRSAKGVTGNIGEGYGRYHYLDSLRFLYCTRRVE